MHLTIEDLAEKAGEILETERYEVCACRCVVVILQANRAAFVKFGDVIHYRDGIMLGVVSQLRLRGICGGAWIGLR